MNAVSIDGRMDHISKHLDLGQFYGIVSKFKAGLHIAGSKTICTMEKIEPENESDFKAPSIDPKDDRPILAIPDSKGRVRVWHMLRKQPFWRDHIALVCKSTPNEYLEYLKKRNIQYIITNGEMHVNMREALLKLSEKYNIETAYCDSGGELNGVLLREGLVSEVYVMILPILVGGTSTNSLFKAPDLKDDSGVINAELASCEKINNIVLLKYTLKQAPPKKE